MLMFDSWQNQAANRQLSSINHLAEKQLSHGSQICGKFYGFCYILKYSYQHFPSCRNDGWKRFAGFQFNNNQNLFAFLHPQLCIRFLERKVWVRLKEKLFSWKLLLSGRHLLLLAQNTSWNKAPLNPYFQR